MIDAERVKELFRGVGVIIDDDINDSQSLISRLKDSVNKAGIPLALYDRVPDESHIESLGNVSFMILDWQFSRMSFNKSEVPYGVDFAEKPVLGDELERENREKVLSFLESLLCKCFLPVFVITEQDIVDVKRQLADHGLYNEKTPNRIMLKGKNEIRDYESLIRHAGEWLEQNPAAMALKMWEDKAVRSKNRMFLDFYKASNEWVGIILASIREDTRINDASFRVADSNDRNRQAVNHEFGDMINNCFTNRMEYGDYDSIVIYKDERERNNYSSDDVRRILQNERYIEYSMETPPDMAYTGDLYHCKQNNEYWLNLRAQCDLSRNSNPMLYLICGRTINADEVIRNDVKLKGSKDDHIIRIAGKEFSVNEINKYGTKETSSFNDTIREARKKFSFSYGEILCKKYQAIVACIANEAYIVFDFRCFKLCEKMKFEQETDKIGRIIPPYITDVQKKFASYMTREGVMSLPKELLNIDDSTNGDEKVTP